MSEFDTTVPGTSVTFSDLVLMGHTMLDLAAATRPMRHESPAGGLDYIDLKRGTPGDIVAAYTSWTAYRPNYEVDRRRLHDFLDESGWQQRVWSDFATRTGGAS